MYMLSKTPCDNQKVIVLATRNQGKITEIKALLKPYPITVLTLDDFDNITTSDEPFDNYYENALHKASLIAKQVKYACLADDSGLEVEALGGLPGVKTARFLEHLSDHNARCQALLDLMPMNATRNATFVACVVIVDGQGNKWHATARLSGMISNTLQGEKGFGYDPIFYLAKQHMTLAQLSFEQKNQLSHRALAIKQVMADWMGDCV